MFSDLEDWVKLLYPDDELLEDLAAYGGADDVIEAVQTGEIDPDNCSDLALKLALANVAKWEPEKLAGVKQALRCV